MVRACQHIPSLGILVLILLATGLFPGCGIVPRSRMDECQKLSQLLRSENAGLKDQVLALRSQNRDYADRAVDDLRRLTARDRAIARLEQSVRAYQDDRERLAGAYEQLRVSLGQPRAEDRVGAESEPAARGTRRVVGARLPDSADPRRNGVARRDDDATSQ